MNAVFVRSEVVAPNIRTLWFKPERPMRYAAGQFTELFLPHAEADDRGERRWFTLSSSPSEELVAITTRFAPERSSSFKRELAALRPGALLKLTDPMGDFVLPKDPTIPLIFVAGGLGITPVRSMVTWLRDRDERRRAQLIYATHDPAELAFRSLFESYPLDFSTHVGSVNPKHVLALAKNNPTARLYISGPEPMTEQLYKALKAKDVAEHRLVTDYFPGYHRL